LFGVRIWRPFCILFSLSIDSCASISASLSARFFSSFQVQFSISQLESRGKQAALRAQDWHGRAKQALERGHEELAREALRNQKEYEVGRDPTVLEASRVHLFSLLLFLYASFLFVRFFLELNERSSIGRGMFRSGPEKLASRYSFAGQSTLHRFRSSCVIEAGCLSPVVVFSKP
jgi:hypothetical protein